MKNEVKTSEIPTDPAETGIQPLRVLPLCVGLVICILILAHSTPRAFEDKTAAADSYRDEMLFESENPLHLIFETDQDGNALSVSLVANGESTAPMYLDSSMGNMHIDKILQFDSNYDDFSALWLESLAIQDILPAAVVPMEFEIENLLFEILYACTYERTAESNRLSDFESILDYLSHDTLIVIWCTELGNQTHIEDAILGFTPRILE